MSDSEQTAPRQTLLSYFDAFPRLGDQIAYVHRRGYRTERWSYRRVAETAARFARELETQKIGRGDAVVLWGENTAEWVAAFFGCLLRGAVVVPMDANASPAFARQVVHQVDAKLVVASRAVAGHLEGFRSLIFEDLDETLAQYPGGRYPALPSKRTDTVEIIFTSGTTAEPKGVVITHGNILTNLEPIETEVKKYLKYERFFHPIRFLNLLPLSHVFGQFLGIFVPQLLAGTVLFPPTLNPGELLRTLRDERVSVLVGVPRLLESLKNKLERDAETEGRLEEFRGQVETAAGMSAWKRWWRFRRIHRRFGLKFWAFVCGGAALEASIETFWQRLGFVVIQGYGLTETTSLISVNHPFKLSRGSVGKVLPGREIKLAEDGEILARGGGLAAAYWHERKLQPVEGEEGWFHTGDIGAFDENGNLFFKGRKKNVIVTAEGMNVYPADLETALRRQPEVRDCVVVEAAPEGSPEPCAVLIVREGNTQGEEAVRRANQDLAQYQRIRRWLLWPESDFPRTPSQKPRLNLIQTWAAARLKGEAGSPPAAGSLGELISRVTGRTPSTLTPSLNLEDDLNLSSVDRVELLSALEDRYQVDLDDTRLAAATTVGQLEELLRKGQAGGPEYHYPAWTQRRPLNWIRVAGYYLLSWPATVLLARPHVSGRERLRDLTGPLLVVSNHVTMADIGFILWALPPRLRHRLAIAMEGERLEALRNPPKEMGNVSGWLETISYYLLVVLFNIFPLPQKAGFRRSFSYAGGSVDRGYSVLVFPEGRRTPDGRMHSFRAGIGLLANRLNVPVLPMRIDGLYELKKAGKRRAAPGEVSVTIGEPLRFPPDSEPAMIARELEERVAALAKENL